MLLHGSDGRETDLLPLAERLMPTAAKVSIRGTVPTPGGYAFFDRFADRRIDEHDLTQRVQPLTKLIQTAVTEHELKRRPIAVAFSNGAIMTAALLQCRPGLFSGAILFRPQPPFTVARDGPLDSLPVLVLDGSRDPRRAPGEGQRLVDSLRRSGADVTHEVLHAGHAICTQDEQVATRWLHRNRSRWEREAGGLETLGPCSAGCEDPDS